MVLKSQYKIDLLSQTQSLQDSLKNKSIYIKPRKKKLKEEGEANYFINGHFFTESELQKLIVLSERSTSFCLTKFCMFVFYHMIFFLLSPFIALPIIYAMEGNVHSLYNMGFLGLTGMSIFQWVTSLMVLISNLHFIYFYFMIEDELMISNYLISDFVHFFLVFACRSMVIGVKYAYYSCEHMAIFRGCTLSKKLNNFSLVSTVALMNDPEEVLDSIDQTLESMKLDHTTFEVGIITDQKEYMIKNITNTMERLKDIRKLMTFYKGDWRAQLEEEYEKEKEKCLNQKCSVEQTYQKYKEAFGKYYYQKKIQHEVDSVTKIMYFGDYDLI